MTTVNESLRRVIRDFTPPIFARAISRCLARTMPVEETMISVRTLEELDAWMQRADEAGAISDDELRRVLGGFQFVVQREFPSDPFSTDYRDAQWELYGEIAGRPQYRAAENELVFFALEDAKRCPFPYCTHSPVTVGEQLIMQGMVLQKMKLPPQASVLEFGAGWGNITLILLQLGYRVTAVDINPSFLDLIAFRAGQLGREVTLVCQDMLQFASDEKYDAVIFFESFHHCWDHWLMLSRLHELLKEDGMLVFGVEPINDMPMPWGVRLDGMAVWSMRKFGWLELGFHPDYFMAALERYGWKGELYRSSDLPRSPVVVARRK